MVIRNEAATRALTVPRLRPWRVRNTTDNCSGFRPPSGGSALISLSRYICFQTFIQTLLVLCQRRYV